MKLDTFKRIEILPATDAYSHPSFSSQPLPSSRRTTERIISLLLSEIIEMQIIE